MRIEWFLAETAAPAALTIEGDAGIGKTTLWRAGIERGQSLGRRVLRARPVEAEADMAFAGLEALLGQAVDEVIDELPGPQRAALEVALLRAEPGPLGVEPRAVASATLSVLRALASRELLLVGIDDLQWLDDATMRALRVALARLRQEPVLVLAALRPGVGDLELGLERDRVTRMKLRGLEVESLRLLVRERLGVSLSLPAGRRLEQLSGGNPYYALELADAERAYPSSAIEGSAGLLALVEQRLSALPVTTRAALGALAAVAHPRMDQVAQLVGDVEVLDPAVAAGVLEQDGQELRFAHPLLAAGAYRTLPPERRRAVHNQLADSTTDEIERARHLAAANDRSDAGVAESIERGARVASARGAPTIAADLFEAAARLAPASGSGAAAARRLEAARELFAAGDGRRALQRCRALLDELPAGELRAEVLTTMAWRGKEPVEEAIAMCEQAISECTTDAGRARCLLLLSNVVQTLDTERALQSAREALALLGNGRDLSLRAWALGLLGAYQGFTDPAGGGIAMLREAWALQLEHGSAAPDVYLEPGTQLGTALMWRDELDEARALLAAQHARATGAGQEAGASTVALHLAELEIRAGNLERARGHAQQGLAIEDEGEDSQTLGALLYVRAHVAALEGHTELARSLARRGLAVGRAVGDGIFPMHNRWVVGQLALALGDAAQAVEYLQSLPAERKALGFLEPGSGPFTSDSVEALIAVGRLDEAEAINTEWEQFGLQLNRPRLLATGARARGLITAARGDPVRGSAILQQALQHHKLLPVPHERARTLLLLGVTLRRAGHRRDARAALDEALAMFESIGQPLWADRARDQLGRLAGRKPTGKELTSTERRVAELVAEGRSNHDVADALFITVRTVESNLTRIYRKLDVRSRSELAARWKDLSA